MYALGLMLGAAGSAILATQYSLGVNRIALRVKFGVLFLLQLSLSLARSLLVFFLNTLPLGLLLSVKKKN